MCASGRPHSDAAKRLRDTYSLHQIASDTAGRDAVGKWFASALEDGSSDGTLYDSKKECIRHQKHNEQRYTYIRIVPHTMNVCEAEVMLATARRLYASGLRMIDPDDRHGGKELIRRLTIEDQLAQMRGAVQNLRMPWEAN